jgi:acyl carrier protein
MTVPASAKMLLADAINADTAAVPDDARIGAFEPWDSIAHLRLILSVEEAIGRQLDPDEAVAIESLPDVTALIDGARDAAGKR